MEVVAEAADGVQAIELYGKYNPDLVLLDMHMPIKDGIRATMESVPNSSRAGLDTNRFDGDEQIHKALQAGAQGYVFKNSSGEN